MNARRNARQAFTLLELMIVVGIIGLLSLIAVPYFIRARTTSLVTRYVSDLRAIETCFVQYSFNTMNFPPDAATGVVPAGMDQYFGGRINWTKSTPLGGQWDWQPDVAGFGHAVRLIGSSISDEDILAADKRLDDGDLTTGHFQKAADGSFLYHIQ